MLALIKAFLKAGIMTEQGRLQGTVTGTPQGGILSPLMANVALSALDEHFARAWEATGGQHERQARRRRGEANYRIVRYADDFVIVVAGERRHAEALIAETEQVIAPLGLALSREKTSIAHIDEGIEFLGWRIQRQTGRKGRPQIYTYPSKPSLQAVMGKVKQITRTGQNQTLDQLLNRLNPVLRGWCDHFRHGVSSRTFGYLRAVGLLAGVLELSPAGVQRALRAPGDVDDLWRLVALAALERLADTGMTAVVVGRLDQQPPRVGRAGLRDRALAALAAGGVLEGTIPR